MRGAASRRRQLIAAQCGTCQDVTKNPYGKGDGVPVQVIRDVLSVVLSVYLPKRLQVLARHHLQPAVAPWMPGEVRDVEHAPHERDDDAALRARVNS